MAKETTIDKETARRLLLILSLEGDVKREEIEWALTIIHQIPGYAGITMAKAVQDDFLREVLVAIAAEQLSSTTPKDLKALIEAAEERKAALKIAKEAGEKKAEEFIEAAEKAAEIRAQTEISLATPETLPKEEVLPKEEFSIKVSQSFIKEFSSVGKVVAYTPLKVVSFFSPPPSLRGAVQDATATSLALTDLAAKARATTNIEEKKVFQALHDALEEAQYSAVARLNLPMRLASITGVRVTLLSGQELGLPRGQVAALLQTSAGKPSLLGTIGKGLGQRLLGQASGKLVKGFLGRAAAKLGAAAAGAPAGPPGIIAGALASFAPDLLSWSKRNASKVAIGIGAFLFGAGFVFQSPILMAGGGAVGFGGLVGGAGGVGPALSKAGGFASSAITGITSLAVASIATPLIVALISIPVLVAIILFIINSGAYVVPPGPATFGGVPPGGNLTKCNPNETGAEITEQLATSIDSGSVRFLPDYLGSRREGLCMTPTMIVLHTSGGYDNDQGNSATYGTLVSRDRSCQLATDTNDTIFMLSFFEKQVESAWCSDDLNAGGVGIEMAGECQGGCAPVAKCSPNTSLTYQPNGPHPCPDLEDLSFDAICKTMRYYKIPWSQVFQHEASNGSHTDPLGDEWVDKFILRLKNSCQV